MSPTCPEKLLLSPLHTFSMSLTTCYAFSHCIVLLDNLVHIHLPYSRIVTNACIILNIFRQQEKRCLQIKTMPIRPASHLESHKPMAIYKYAMAQPQVATKNHAIALSLLLCHLQPDGEENQKEKAKTRGLG